MRILVVMASYLCVMNCYAQSVDTLLSFSLRADTVNPLYYVSGPFKRCPATGKGKRFDPYLNTLKNRDIPPPGSYSFATIDEIISYRPKLAVEEGGKARRKWKYEAASAITSWEKRGVTIEGYLLDVKVMDTENCNCNSKIARDYHLWIVADRGQSKASSLVVEITPRMLERNPHWANVEELIGQQIRVSGWLFWDSGHGAHVRAGKRGAEWEVHPVLEIQTLDDSEGWKGY